MPASLSRILLASFLGTAAAQACTGNRGPCPLGDDHVFTNDSNESSNVFSDGRAKCGDYGAGCYAPDDEARVCKLPGYRVEPSWERQSEWCVGVTVGIFGQSAIYQCCTGEEHGSGDSNGSTGAIGSIAGGISIGCFAPPCIPWLSGAFAPRCPSPLRPSMGREVEKARAPNQVLHVVQRRLAHLTLRLNCMFPIGTCPSSIPRFLRQHTPREALTPRCGGVGSDILYLRSDILFAPNAGWHAGLVMSIMRPANVPGGSSSSATCAATRGFAIEQDLLDTYRYDPVLQEVIFSGGDVSDVTYTTAVPKRTDFQCDLGATAEGRRSLRVLLKQASFPPSVTSPHPRTPTSKICSHSLSHMLCPLGHSLPTMLVGWVTVFECLRFVAHSSHTSLHVLSMYACTHACIYLSGHAYGHDGADASFGRVHRMCSCPTFWHLPQLALGTGFYANGRTHVMLWGFRCLTSCDDDDSPCLVAQKAIRCVAYQAF